MTAYEKRLRKNVLRNQVLNRELDFLPATIDRDDVREIARKYGPQRRRSFLARIVLGMVEFIFRYSAPFLGMVVGAEFAAAKALYPLIGEKQQFGESLRFFLGEDLSEKIEDANMAFKVTGSLVAATPDIIFAALYGALIGVAVYCVVKWGLILGVSAGRKRKLRRSVQELLG